MNHNALASLRRLVQPRTPRERCELCSAEIPHEHPHLVEPAVRRLVCVCQPCAVLFSHREGGKYRRVPRRVERLADFRLSDVQWEGLGLLISLAFFLHSSAAGRVVAVFPSPGGAKESLLPLEAWQEVVAENPVLGSLEPDVEALLVNRVRGTREHFRVGIDECYKLVGLIRMHWQGFSGGPRAWDEIARFFAALKERAHA
jgi:hypothetical protein